MPDSDSDLDLDLSPAAPPVAPDVMARILEPRVRSNAKNNPKAKATGPKKPSADQETMTQESILVDEKADAMERESSGGQAVVAPNANELGEIRDLLLALQENQTGRDRAFDLLYEELGGYKNDFYLERLKPTLRALLFLLDSIQEFEREIEVYEANNQTPSSEIVRANLIHFRDQLTDVLTLSEMAPIEPESDQFDPKTQRAVEVVSIEPAQNNTVQRQIRGGWKLGGKMLRPADVVVGRSG